MKRIQIYIDEPLDAVLDAEASRSGRSKAALIREAASVRFGSRVGSPAPGGWDAMIGWLDGPAVDDIDEVVYGGTA
jgi:hypothetical protein